MSEYPRCPECGSGCEQQTVGFFDGIDRNRAWCQCGWAGRVYEMDQPADIAAAAAFEDEAECMDHDGTDCMYYAPIVRKAYLAGVRAERLRHIRGRDDER